MGGFFVVKREERRERVRVRGEKVAYDSISVMGMLICCERDGRLVYTLKRVIVKGCGAKYGVW